MNTTFKILCTGNPTNAGIAQAVQEFFPDTTFVSRSHGYDLSTTVGLDKFASIVKNYNVFINNSQISPGTQERLLNIVHSNWTSGHVFNIGSIAEYKKWEWFDPAYTQEKRSLKENSLAMCTENFKTTHIIVGGFQDSSSADPARMNPLEIVKFIKYILESNINIPLIGIEKIIDDNIIKRENKC